MDFLYNDTDDVTGDTRIQVWTNGVGDLHVSISSEVDDTNHTVYIRKGEQFAKKVLKGVW